MPLPPPTLLTLGETARHLAKTTGEAVALHQVLDWAAQGCFALWLPLERQAVRFEDAGQATTTLSQVLVALAPSAAQAAELGRGNFVKFEAGTLDGRPLRFVSARAGGRGYPEDEAISLTCDQLRVKREELEAVAQQVAGPAPEPQQGGAPDPEEMDPADRPVELDIANIAFAAVHNGYGAPNATFKNRLLAYLKAHYPKMSDEGMQRIATVANRDKGAGRRKG